MSAASSVVLTLPTTSGSFDQVSTGSESSISDSDEEIVWHGISSSEPSTESSVGSDSDDYVLLGRANSESSPSQYIGTSTRLSEESPRISDADNDLSTVLANVALSAVPEPLGPGIERPSSTTTITQVTAPTRMGNKSLPVVDDELSDSETSECSISTVSDYDQASAFMTLFLSQPMGNVKDSACRLAILHSLIVELGILPTSSLPKSIRASRVLLHSQVHINVRDYIAVREQGQAALQKVMFPSRNALVKSIRKKENRVPVKWVKEKGLDGLLVTFRG